MANSRSEKTSRRKMRQVLRCAWELIAEPPGVHSTWPAGGHTKPTLPCHSASVASWTARIASSATNRQARGGTADRSMQSRGREGRRHSRARWLASCQLQPLRLPRPGRWNPHHSWISQAAAWCDLLRPDCDLACRRWLRSQQAAKACDLRNAASAASPGRRPQKSQRSQVARSCNWMLSPGAGEGALITPPTVA